MTAFIEWAVEAIPRWIREHKKLIALIIILLLASTLYNISMGEWKTAGYAAKNVPEQLTLTLKGVGFRLIELLFGLPFYCCCCLIPLILGGLLIYLVIIRPARNKWKEL